MVAQLKPQPGGGSGPPTASPSPSGPPPALHGVSAASQATTEGASAYDLDNAEADFNTWRTYLLNYMQTTLIPIDNYYEMRQPTTPYFAVAGQSPRQYVSPLIRNGLDGVLAFIRPQSITIACSADDNPAAAPDERSDTEGALRFIFDFHNRKGIADIFQTIKRQVGARGSVMVQISWLDAADAAAANKKFPVRLDVHDIFDCAWHTGEDGQVKQALILKKKAATEVPADWLTAVAIDDPNAEVNVLEYWDEYASGAVIEGTIVKPLTPHGYVDAAGDPACPIVFIPHEARPQRLGGVAPLASGVSQRGILMGTPVVEALLPHAENDSRLKTRLFFYTDMAMRGLLKVKGIAQRDGKAAIDFDTGILELEDTPQSEAEWLAPPQVSNAFQMLSDMVTKDAGGAFASQATMMGDQPMNISGTSFNHQSTWSRAKAESFAISLEQGYTKICHILIGMLRQNLVASAATHYQKQMQKPLPLRRNPGATGASAQSPWDQGVVLPFYKGGGVRDIDNLTFQNILAVTVTVEPDTRTPRETEMQQAIGLAGSQNPLVPLAWIRKNLMHVDNELSIADQIQREKAEADPTSPWGMIRMREAMVDSYLSEITDPAQRDQITQALMQYKQQTIMQALMQPPGQPDPGQSPPSGGQGGPPGPPPGTPPGNAQGQQAPPFPQNNMPPNPMPPGPQGMGMPMQPGPLAGQPPVAPFPPQMGVQ